jgi:hypothetical protein
MKTTRLLIAAISGSFVCLVTWRINSLDAMGFFAVDWPWYLLWILVNSPIYFILGLIFRTFDLSRAAFFVVLYPTMFVVWFLLGFFLATRVYFRLYARFCGQPNFINAMQKHNEDNALVPYLYILLPRIAGGGCALSFLLTLVGKYFDNNRLMAIAMLGLLVAVSSPILILISLWIFFKLRKLINGMDSTW